VHKFPFLEFSPYLSTFSCCTKKGDHCTLTGRLPARVRGPEYARRFPQFKSKALIRNEVARPHHFTPFQNAGSVPERWLARLLLVRLRCVGLARQFIALQSRP
jgi:hypothetical protein